MEFPGDADVPPEHARIVRIGQMQILVITREDYAAWTQIRGDRPMPDIDAQRQLQ